MKRLLLAILVLQLPLLLVPRAQGIRLVKDVPVDSVDTDSGELPRNMQRQGKDRKLLKTATIAPTTPTANLKAHGRDIKRNEAASKGNAKEGLSVKSLTTKFEHYPDVIDIAGMDYSPAKRRPPIHN